MRFAVLDHRLYERVKDDPGLILDWDPAAFVARLPAPGGRLKRTRDKRRARQLADVFAAFEDMKRDLHAL